MTISMTSSPKLGLIPLNDCILVELQQSYKNVSKAEGKYDSRTEGIVVAIPNGKLKGLLRGDPIYDKSEVEYLLGKRVHFEEFKEGARIKRGGKIYSFIKIEDIRGYEENV